MGARLRQSLAIVKAMEEISGEQAILDQIYETIVTGGTPKQLAEEKFGICVSALWQWMKAAPNRTKLYRDALKAQADALAHESVAAVNNATVDNVQVAKLQADHKLKMAAKWDPENYDSVRSDGKPIGAGINVYVQRGAALVIDGDNSPPVLVTPATLENAA